MAEKRFTVPDPRKLRNLKQYRDLSDEEFDELFEQEFEIPTETLEAMEKAIEQKIDELGEDYDLSDMKANDLRQIRSLAQVELQLDAIESQLYSIRLDSGYTVNNAALVEKLNRMASVLRSDASSIYNDLAITKKERKKDQEASVHEALENIRQKARKFAHQTMVYVFCPKCKMLLSTAWVMYKDRENLYTTQCKKCDAKLEVNLSELYETGNKNIKDILLP